MISTTILLTKGPPTASLPELGIPEGIHDAWNHIGAPLPTNHHPEPTPSQTFSRGGCFSARRSFHRFLEQGLLNRLLLSSVAWGVCTEEWWVCVSHSSLSHPNNVKQLNPIKMYQRCWGRGLLQASLRVTSAKMLISKPIHIVKLYATVFCDLILGKEGEDGGGLDYFFIV